MQIIYLPLLLECNRFFARPMEKPRIAEPLARPPLGEAGRGHATACVPLRSANRRCVQGRNRVHSRNRETGARPALSARTWSEARDARTRLSARQTLNSPSRGGKVPKVWLWNKGVLPYKLRKTI